MKNIKSLALSIAITLTLSISAMAQSAPDPNTTAICQGETKVLASSVTGTTYQWYKDGSLISGETNKQYSAVSAGSYSVVAINEHGCSTDASEPVALLIIQPGVPIIATTNNSSCFTSSNEVILTGSGVPSNIPNGLSYRLEWRKTGSNTVIANSTTLTLKNVSESGKYTFTIVPIWNGNDMTCSKTSVEESITINAFAAKPSISSNIDGYLPNDEQKAGIVCERNNVTLTASVNTSDPNFTTAVNYKWYFNGSEIQGQTTATLALNNIQVSSTGSYTVKAFTTSGCEAMSDAFVIDVKARLAQPVITY